MGLLNAMTMGAGFITGVLQNSNLLVIEKYMWNYPHFHC